MENYSLLEKKFNFKRKLWHMLGLIVPLLLYLDVFKFISPQEPEITRKIGSLLIFITLLFLLIVEILRLNSSTFNSFFIKNFGFLMKESEYHRIHGSISYIYAIFLLFIFFSKEVIVISLLTLMICDPIAAYVGIFYGKRKLANQKTLEGTIAFTLSSFIVILLFIYLTDFFNESNYLKKTNFQNLLIITLFTSLITAIVETFSFTALEGFLDDNLTIPLSVSISFSILSYFHGIPVENYFIPLLSFTINL